MLILDSVSMTFNPGTVNEKQALRDLSLHLKPGEFASVIGSNGAGKSTMLNAISGSFLPDRGIILLGGENITFLESHKRSRWIGRLFQDPQRGTAPSMSIEENLALAYLRGSRTKAPLSLLSRREKAYFREQLARLEMGLEDRPQQPVGLLSGGQRQALALLMATIIPPKLLLLDEHTAALDPGAAEKVMALTKRIVEENAITCLMVTHNMAQALRYGSRTLMMSEGRIVLDLSGKERDSISVEELIARFKARVSTDWENDRMLLSETE